MHMPITYGKIAIQKVDNIIQECEEPQQRNICFECHLNITGNDLMICVNPQCNLHCHVICFSRYFICKDDAILPVEGKCPSCGIQILWGDLVRKKKGCYKNLVEDNDQESIFLD